MKFLKGAAYNLLVGLNVFILFFLFFEQRIEVPPLLLVAGRMHPLVLHFPLVILILACVLEFFSPQLPLEEKPLKWLIWLLLFTGALSSSVTVAFGLLLSREEGYSGSLMEGHKWAGVAVCFLACLLWLFYKKLPRRPLLSLMGLVLAVVIGAGHLGASLTHGEDFVLAPLRTSTAYAPDLSDAVVYADLVAPILQNKCLACHNIDKSKGGLVMTDTVSLAAGGESGKLVLAGNSGESLLIERLLLDIDHKHRMPPKGKPQLTEAEIALVRAWIDEGASFSARLTNSAPSERLRELAGAVYGPGPAETFDFPAADKSLIAQLNNSYRLVAPIALHAPALDVRFFGRKFFQKSALAELEPIRNQLVHLNLGGMTVGDNEMGTVASFPNLRQLDLSNTEVTDSGLVTLMGLEKLEFLFLTGTDVSKNGLEKLLALPRLKEVYVWNTRVTPDEAKNLTQAHAGIRIETGASGADTTLLQLNPLLMLPENSFFREPFQLSFDHPIHQTGIRYTLDGADPDTINGTVYQGPFLVQANTRVRARASKEGWLDSDIVEKYFQHTSFLPDTFSLLTAPHPLHKGRGTTSLFDLREGNTDIRYISDGNWLGYFDSDFSVELIFEKPVTLSEVTLSTLTSTGLKAFPPGIVTVWTMDEAGQPVSLARLSPAPPDKNNKIQHNRIDCSINYRKPVSYLKIVATPLKKMPAWHKEAGQPAWLFIDEILLN